MAEEHSTPPAPNCPGVPIAQAYVWRVSVMLVVVWHVSCVSCVCRVCRVCRVVSCVSVRAPKVWKRGSKSLRAPRTIRSQSSPSTEASLTVMGHVGETYTVSNSGEMG